MGAVCALSRLFLTSTPQTTSNMATVFGRSADNLTVNYCAKWGNEKSRLLPKSIRIRCFYLTRNFLNIFPSKITIVIVKVELSSRLIVQKVILFKRFHSRIINYNYFAISTARCKPVFSSELKTILLKTKNKVNV